MHGQQNVKKNELDVFMNAHFGTYALFTHLLNGAPYLATTMYLRTPANDLYLPHNSHRCRYL